MWHRLLRSWTKRRTERYIVPQPLESPCEDVSSFFPAQLNEDGWGVAHFPTGILALRGSFQDGFMTHGQIFRENGILHFDGILDKNRLVSGRLYDDAGCLQYEGDFQNGAPEGMGSFFYRDGSVCVGIFHDGELVDIHLVEENDQDESHLCLFCFCPLNDNEDSYIYIPCGHRIMCGPCKDSISVRWTTSCPMCKSDSTLTRVIHA